MELKAIYVWGGENMETKIVLPAGDVETRAWPETNFLLSILKMYLLAGIGF